MNQNFPNRIVLIDDDKDDCFLFEEALMETRPGAEFKCFYSCIDLGDKLREFSPDLIFLDINMPIMPGFECLQQILSEKPFSRLPVVVFSSSKNERDINVSYGMGAKLFFQKPSSYQQLVKELREILQLDWYNPGSIATRQFVGGKYIPYSSQN